MKNKRSLWFLTAIIAFHLLNNFVIIKSDTVPPLMHTELYYELSVKSYNLFLKSPKAFTQEFLNLNPHYPPLLYVSAAPFYFLFGTSYDTACMAVSIIYLTLLLVCVYLIGTRLFSSQVGLLAAFLCSFFPSIFGYSRIFTMALPTEALLVLGVYLMLRSDYFKKSGYAAAFGLGVGFGMLMRRHYAVSLFGIFLSYLFAGRRNILASRKKVFINLLIAAVLIGVVAGPWYVKHAGDTIWQLAKEKPTVFFQEGKGIEIDFSTYLYYIYNYQIGIVFFILFICCFLYLLFRKKLNFIILSWILWPYFVYSLFITLKSARYTMSMLPAMALLMAQAIVEFTKGLKGKKAPVIKVAVISVICVYSLCNFFYTCYAKKGTALNWHDIDKRWYHSGLRYPGRVNWNVEELIEVFLSSGQARAALSNTAYPRKKVVVDAYGQYYYIDAHARQVIKSRQLPIDYIKLDFERIDSSDFEPFLEKADFLIMWPEDSPDIFDISASNGLESVKKFRGFIELFNRKYKGQFTIVKKMFIDSHNTFLVLKRIK